MTLASLARSDKGNVTCRERFLAEMNAEIPWGRLFTLIDPYYPRPGKGTQLLPLERMLPIYFMQNWFNLSHPGADDALYDSESMRRIAVIDLAKDTIPAESTILRFRHLLERHGLTERIFAEVRGSLEEKRLQLESGTIVDATIIATPPSTSNAEKARDPDMRQARNGKTWHFGMKAHVGTETRGIVYSVVTTPANTADTKQLRQLLHGQEKELFGDQAYWNEFHRHCAKEAGVRYRVNCRGTQATPLTEHQRAINRSRSKARTRGEHAIKVVNRLRGFGKVRYRCLVNLNLLRRRILLPGEPCLL